MIRKAIFGSMLAAAATLFSIVNANAQNIEKPAIQGKTSYAVIVDQTTLDKCRAEIDSYKAVIESEGLPTFIVSDTWCCPDKVRNVIKDLYKNNNLEGVFLIGDIPIAMITRASHLATAFKMDEREAPIGKASVPSDRFYDDLDLEFIPAKDSADGLKFFYQLSPVSPQYIECDIYSARLKPLAGNGCKYAQISKYLKKAVTVHKEHNHFDDFVSYTGYGSYSECIKAWRAEQQILQEQCPGIFEKYNNAKFLRFSMDPYMKKAVVRELRRDDSDFMVIHAHGMPDRQYLSETPNSVRIEQMEYIKYDLRDKLRSRHERVRKEAIATAQKWGLDSIWYADYNTPEMIKKDSIENAKTGILLGDIDVIAPNTRFIIMDCCFNGDFRYDDFIAGKYIMSEGKCMVAFANSVNVLQDKSAFDQIGLLPLGARVGNWAKYNNILESHIFGDPTFHFNAHHSQDINEMMANNSNEFWFNHLNNTNPEIQNIAVIKLVNNNYKGVEEILLNKVLESEHAIVRFNALMLLEKLNHPNWHTALEASIKDSFEFTRRIAVNRMGVCGNVKYIPYLVEAFVNDYSALRVKYNILEALKCFDANLVLEHIEKYFADKTFFLAPRYKKELIEAVSENKAATSLATFYNPQASKEDKIYRAQYLRNCQYHQNVDKLIDILLDANTEPEVRQYLVESFGWFRRSYKREKILDAVEKMYSEKQFVTPDMEQELQRAITKLKSVK